MTKLDRDRLWNLQFAAEVSARYHEWRRAFLERWITIVRVVSAVGAVLSLVGLSWTGNAVIFGLMLSGPYLIGIGSAAIATFNIVDFVLGADALARDHTELYRRFKELQERMARYQDNWPDHIAGWEADAQSIRRDEPPTLWALYMVSWNQAVERRDPKNLSGARQISLWQRFTKNFVHYLPFNFPERA